MTRLILFLLTAGLSAHASEPISTSPDCSGEKIVFHGEMAWGEVVTNDEGEQETKIFRERIPLPRTHSIHSDNWKKILIQVPPEKRSRVKRWGLEITSETTVHTDSGNDSEEGHRQTQSYEFGKNDEGLYPVEGMEFEDVAYKSGEIINGQLIFFIKDGRKDICQFSMRVHGHGD